MNPVYKQVIGVLLSLTMMTISCYRCQQRSTRNDPHPWDTELEKQMTEVFYTQSAGITNDTYAREKYAKCCMEKMKELFPKGISNLDLKMTDSMKVSIMQMGAECAGVFKHKMNIWQPETENQLKLQLYSLEEVKMMPEKLKKEYVDCITFKVTAEFPNGLGENEGKKTIQKFINKSRHECIVLIGNKYKVPRSVKKSINKVQTL